MDAVAAVAAILRAVPGGLYVSSLGTATSALRAAGDEGPHLYLGGSMGSALAVAIGVADKRPDRDVVALLGDGEALMGVGSLWSVAGICPPNLLVVVLADGRYSITGGQPLGAPLAFAAVAAALGVASASIEEEAELSSSVASLTRPALIEIRCEQGPWPGPSPFVDPPAVRWRFEQAFAVRSGKV